MNDTDLTRLTCTYIVANTPSFVWSRFKVDPAIAWLIEVETPESLEKTLKSISLDSPDISAVVKAYAYFIALLQLDPSAGYRILKESGFGRLAWGNAIASLASPRTSSDSIHPLKARPTRASRPMDNVKSVCDKRVLIAGPSGTKSVSGVWTIEPSSPIEEGDEPC